MTGLSDLDLRQGFDAFIDAARRLETSYRDLRKRAEAMDLELNETNRRLETALDEREALFRALPLGLVVVRARQAAFCNPEAERLCAQAREHGVDLLQSPTGDLRFGSAALRVRRETLPGGDDLVVLEDRSRLRHLEQEVHRLDRLAGLSELAMGVAHEIKNPLNGVQGFAQLLQRSRDPETCRRHADKIIAGVDQIDGIVKALLAFAQAGEGRARSVPVGQLVTPAAAGAGVPRERIHAHGALEEPVPEDALLRVLVNLLRNSAEACDDLRVELEVSATPSEVRIQLWDNGPGVPAELRSRLFEPFVSSKASGHGLGLALCARVLAYLGGSLAYAPAESGGAGFEVVLPRLVDGGAP